MTFASESAYLRAPELRRSPLSMIFGGVEDR